jgi:centrosome and spindle pole-associated protein 1
MPGMAGPPVGYDNPAYTTTAVPPSFHNMGSMYSPSSSSPVRGFQAGANAAAAVAAMQAAAARSGGLGPPSGSWGFSPTAASANAVDAPFAQQQQWPQVDRGSAAPGRFNPASMGPSAGAAAAGVGASLAGLGGDSSTSSPQRGRGGVQDKARKDAYRAELEAQIRERAERQAVEKAHRAAEEARKEAEMAAYCPWGRGGAGAPLRDASGQVGVQAWCQSMHQVA